MADDTAWTPVMVAERLEEAMNVLQRLPMRVRPRGYFSVWPRVVYEFSDLVGQEPPLMRRPPPSPAAISRMEETLTWTHGLDPVDARIVWQRANRIRWKEIAREAGMSRKGAYERYVYALCLIACRLNRRPLSGRRSRRQVIDSMWREERELSV
jgi:hypothetical protein